MELHPRKTYREVKPSSAVRDKFRKAAIFGLCWDWQKSGWIMACKVISDRVQKGALLHSSIFTCKEVSEPR